VAKLRSQATTPSAELKIATAGPAVSFAAAALFAVVADALDRAGGPELAVDAAAWLALINGVLALFNLAPAAPLDGGRILHALVWKASGDRDRATRVSTGAGRVFGYLLVGVGIVMVASGSIGGAWIAFVGWFVISAATAEATHALLKGALGGVRVRDVMTAHPVTVGGDQRVDDLLDEAFLRHHCSSFPVVDRAGHPMGLVTLRRMRSVAPEDRTHLTAADIAIPLERALVVRPDDLLLDALESASPDAQGDGRMLVFSNGQLVGIVSPTDVNRAIELAGLRKRRPGSGL
jgi:CBS domain-containing protein